MNGEINNLNINAIKNIVPNRYPYLLIDYVTQLIPGKSATGYKNLTANEWFFPVHFPEEPMMPGMLQMEALLQMISVIVLSLDCNKGKVVRGVSAKNIKLKGHVVPGNQFKIEAEIKELSEEKGIAIARGIIADKEVCSAEFGFDIINV